VYVVNLSNCYGFVTARACLLLIGWRGRCTQALERKRDKGLERARGVVSIIVIKSLPSQRGLESDLFTATVLQPLKAIQNGQSLP
jgi:hypothetical protein